MSEYLSDRVITPGIPGSQAQPAIRQVPAWLIDPRHPKTEDQLATLAAALVDGVSFGPLARVAALSATGARLSLFKRARSLLPVERDRVLSGEMSLDDAVKLSHGIEEEIAKVA
jgi:hypothetical protein